MGRNSLLLLNGETNSLLIDTGLGVGNIKEVVDRLTDLPVKVVTTHVHWDHIGGHRHFDNIGVYEIEKDWLESNFPVPINIVRMNLLKEPCEFPDYFDAENYHVFQGKPDFILHDNDLLDLGGRKIRVIHTPGHSPGHVCFFEEERGYLFTGDLIYEGTLDAFYPSTNPVDFMKSVKRIKDLPVKRVLPAHHRLNIGYDLILDIDKAFTELYNSGMLIKENGIYYFKSFNIHI